MLDELTAVEVVVRIFEAQNLTRELRFEQGKGIACLVGSTSLTLEDMT